MIELCRANKIQFYRTEEIKRVFKKRKKKNQTILALKIKWKSNCVNSLLWLCNLPARKVSNIPNPSIGTVGKKLYMWYLDIFGVFLAENEVRVL